MNQKHLLRFYTSNTIKSNEETINYIASDSNFPPWLILHWTLQSQCLL